MLFPKEDYKNIRYAFVFEQEDFLDNPRLKPYMEAIADLGLVPGWTKKLIRYVFAYYDKRSPIVKQVSNLTIRKQEAAEIAGFDLQQDQETLEEIFRFEDEGLQRLAIMIMREQDDMYWSMIVSNEQCFWEYQQALNTSIRVYKDDKQRMDALNVKSKLMEECDKITQRVEEYRSKVFGDGETAAKARIKDFSPESIAGQRHA